MYYCYIITTTQIADEIPVIMRQQVAYSRARSLVLISEKQWQKLYKCGNLLLYSIAGSSSTAGSILEISVLSSIVHKEIWKKRRY